MLLLLSLLACSDYNINKNEDPVDDPEETGDTEDPWDTADTQGDEECNGEDDDGDGEIDEGFEDSDGDGWKDCMEQDCDVEIPSAGVVPINKLCEGIDSGSVKDPWNVVEEWSYTAGPVGSALMPAVGNLTDDDGDGDIDEDDTPDIAFVEFGSGTLYALHGDGSGVIFSATGYYGGGGITIADVDVDGEPEIIATNSSRQIRAVSGSGTVEWTSTISTFSSYPQPAVADLDADGDVEVVYDTEVVEGATGATIATLGGTHNSWRTPVLADIDQDGSQEIILSRNVYDSSGTLLWTASAPGAGSFNAVADVDGDVGGEVFFVSGSQMAVYEPDGTLITTVSVPGSNPGPPCIADFDGDGSVEIAIPANTQISVFELSGTRNWTQTINDTSGLAGCSGYDVDGDNVYEVLYGDQDTFRMYDGSTGTVLYSNTDHISGTLWEYPVIADVDNDDSAEVIIASNTYGTSGTWMGVTVLGHNGDGWPKSGPTWGTHDFAVTNINQDGSIPTTPTASWLEHNVFRARPGRGLPGHRRRAGRHPRSVRGHLRRRAGQGELPGVERGRRDRRERRRVAVHRRSGGRDPRRNPHLRGHRSGRGRGGPLLRDRPPERARRRWAAPPGRRRRHRRGRDRRVRRRQQRTRLDRLDLRGVSLHPLH